MKEKRHGITKVTGSILALLICIVYTLMTILFIVRHSMDLKLFLLSAAVMIGMIFVAVSMWLGYFKSLRRKISGASILNAKIGLLLLMAYRVILVLGNGALLLWGISITKKVTGKSFKEYWSIVSRSVKNGRLGFELPSFGWIVAMAVIVGIIIALGIASYIMLGIFSNMYVVNLKRSSKKHKTVKGTGLIISLLAFCSCNVFMLIMKTLIYLKVHSYHKGMKHLKKFLNGALDAARDSGYFTPFRQVNVKWGMGMSTGALVMDIIYTLLLIAFAVLVCILVKRVEMASMTAHTGTRLEEAVGVALTAQGRNNEKSGRNRTGRKRRSEDYEDLLLTEQVADGEQQSAEVGETERRQEPLVGTITCVSGTDAGFVYQIQSGEELIIGKEPKSAHIVIETKYPQVSRRHCGIRYVAATGSYLVTDYSSNGTFIDGKQRLVNGIETTVERGKSIWLATDRNIYKLG